jgi:hypothetical protein
MIYVSSAIIGILLLGVQVVAANKPSDVSVFPKSILTMDLRESDNIYFD